MRPFDLFGNNTLHSHHLLEASAGTGKTYSIENLVVRFLLEENPSLGRPLALEELLIMTFTRAATDDLKVRIRSNIARAIELLDSQGEGPLADYLASCEPVAARRRLEEALFIFDQAPIVTIHSFCSRMLSELSFESGISFEASGSDDQTIGKSGLGRLVRDFFRSEVTPDLYSPEQLEIAVRSKKGSVAQLEKALSGWMVKGAPFLLGPSYSELLAAFNAAMRRLKSEQAMSRSKLLEDYEAQAPCYKQTAKHREAVEAFAALFDLESWDGKAFDSLLRHSLPLAELFLPSNLKKTPPPPETLHTPALSELLSAQLKPIIDEGSNPEAIIARMASGCRELMLARLDAEEHQTHEGLLRAMAEAVEHETFAEGVRRRYGAAIVDEFQDTDPLQWRILKTLFLNGSWSGALYIVGDPKQSIYGFRQADIYTYLAAAEKISCTATLATNYRSQPRLVEAINLLFSSPGLLALPRYEEALPYREVAAGRSDSLLEEKERAPLHFFIAEGPKKRKNSFPLEQLEEEFFFPFIVEEIAALKRELDYRDIAFIVKDRNQAKRLSQAFDAAALPYRLQRTGTLAGSPAKKALWELLYALLYPRDESALKTALGNRLFGWEASAIEQLSDSCLYEEVLNKINQLRSLFSQEGFGPLYEELMGCRLREGESSVKERLLAQPGGLDFYCDLEQLASLLIEEQNRESGGGDSLLTYLEGLEELENNDNEKIKRRSDPSRDAMTIITMHSSKGLEYPVVFALGVVNRTRVPDKIVPIIVEGETLFAAKESSSKEYQHYCRELDAEKARQLYVTLTRARERLYIPVIISPSSEAAAGRASPLELLLARLNQEPAENPYDKINGYDGAPLRRLIAENPLLSATELNGMSFAWKAAELPASPPLAPPKKSTFTHEKSFLHSFTSLSRQPQGSHEQIEGAPHNFAPEKKGAHTLPAGSDSGTLLHTLLEVTPFSAADPLPHIAPHLAGSRYEPWKECLAKMVADAFGADLGGFSLRDVEEHCCTRESDFLYPCRGAAPLEEFTLEGGYLKGVIDLLFLHQGRYYLLDWKSNWLGPDDESYTAEAMKQAMEQHNYFLQAALYREAAARYLSLIEKRPFEELFGGCYYLFLRGLSAGSSRGVYYFKEGADG